MNIDNITGTGSSALALIDMGLEVAADMECEEEQPPPGELAMAATLRRLVAENGLHDLLATIHDAALGAAEMHEEDDEVTCVRLHVFSLRMREAMNALK